MKAALTAGAMKSKHDRERWVRGVERRIATGKGSHRPDLMPKFSRHQADEILRFGAKALGVGADLCERQYIPVPEGLDLTRIERAHAAVVRSSGASEAAITSSRCSATATPGRSTSWSTAAAAATARRRPTTSSTRAKARGLPRGRREDSWLRADEPLGKEYWAHHNSAANFAVANRHIIVEGIRAATQGVSAPTSRSTTRSA